MEVFASVSVGSVLLPLCLRFRSASAFILPPSCLRLDVDLALLYLASVLIRSIISPLPFCFRLSLRFRLASASVVAFAFRFASILPPLLLYLRSTSAAMLPLSWCTSHCLLLASALA